MEHSGVFRPKATGPKTFTNSSRTASKPKKKFTCFNPVADKQTK